MSLCINICLYHSKGPRKIINKVSMVQQSCACKSALKHSINKPKEKLCLTNLSKCAQYRVFIAMYIMYLRYNLILYLCYVGVVHIQYIFLCFHDTEIRGANHTLRSSYNRTYIHYT